MPSGPPRDVNITNARSNSFVVKLNQAEPSDLNGIFTQFKITLMENCRNGSIYKYEFFTLASNESVKSSNHASGNNSLPKSRSRRFISPGIPNPADTANQALNLAQNNLNNVMEILNNASSNILNNVTGTNSETARGNSSSKDLQATTHVNVTELKLGLSNKIYFSTQHDSFEILISGLLPYTFYNVSIATCTKVGCGPAAHWRDRTEQSGK